MNHQKLKKHFPLFPEEWLEDQEHRERWDPKVRLAIDQHIKETFPVTPEDHAKGKKIRERQG